MFEDLIDENDEIEESFVPYSKEYDEDFWYKSNMHLMIDFTDDE
jgi:hypothetical protein